MQIGHHIAALLFVGCFRSRTGHWPHLHHKQEMYRNYWLCRRALLSLKCLAPRISRRLPFPCPILYEMKAENCVLLGYYAASSGNSLSTLRNNLSVPSLQFDPQRRRRITTSLCVITQKNAAEARITKWKLQSCYRLPSYAVAVL